MYVQLLQLLELFIVHIRVPVALVNQREMTALRSSLGQGSTVAFQVLRGSSFHEKLDKDLLLKLMLCRVKPRKEMLREGSKGFPGILR